MCIFIVQPFVASHFACSVGQADIAGRLEFVRECLLEEEPIESGDVPLRLPCSRLQEGRKRTMELDVAEALFRIELVRLQNAIESVFQCRERVPSRLGCVGRASAGRLRRHVAPWILAGIRVGAVWSRAYRAVSAGADRVRQLDHSVLIEWTVKAEVFLLEHLIETERRIVPIAHVRSPPSARQFRVDDAGGKPSAGVTELSCSKKRGRVGCQIVESDPGFVQ
jgi:hypothetical protein